MKNSTIILGVVLIIICVLGLQTIFKKNNFEGYSGSHKGGHHKGGHHGMHHKDGHNGSHRESGGQGGGGYVNFPYYYDPYYLYYYDPNYPYYY